MKTADLMIGGYYEARVSGGLTVVRLDSEAGRRYTGIRTYNAVNLRTGKSLVITAARLRRRLPGGQRHVFSGIIVPAT